MSDLFSGLNDMQSEAVSSTEGYYRIIAGAGSGKTRTLTHRFAYLVRELGVPARNILCVTFTNKAAAEMKARIKKLLGAEIDASLITTYHGFCVKVLKEDINRLFYPSNFKILDVKQQKRIIEEIYAAYDIKLDYKTFEEALEHIRREKADLKYIDMMVDPAYSFSANAAADLEGRIYIKYLEYQKKIYGLDFNDLLYFAIYLFQHHEDILEKWKTRLHYIQVDEFQDSSKKELDIVNMLCRGNNNLFVVGDPDQNIYEWRNSDNSFLVNFEKNYPNVKTILLTQNYRSTPEILNAGNSLIAKNINRVPKDLFTENPPGIQAEHVHFRDDEEEAKWLTEKIKETAKKNGYSDIAVLFRSSFLSRRIEQTLYHADIPYMIHGGVKFFDRAEIKDSIAFLKLINDVRDDDSFLRIINVPKRQIGKTRIDYIKNIQKEVMSGSGNKAPLFEILREARDEDFLSGTGAGQFVDIINEFGKKVAEGMKVSEILNGVLDLTGYKAYISRSGDMERFDNVTELLASISEFEMQAGEDVNLAAYIQWLGVISDYESGRAKNCVNLMTIHSAKGLEFPYVIIAGMTDGIFPSRRTVEERQSDGLEEERRLCYVAITRAMRELYLIESENGAMKQLPSRFLYEIDEQYIKRVNKVPGELIKKVKAKAKQTGKQPEKSAGFKIADFVRHKVFGTGRIAKEDSNSYYIEFEKSANPKPIAKTYDGLVRAEASLINNEPPQKPAGDGLPDVPRQWRNDNEKKNEMPQAPAEKKTEQTEQEPANNFNRKLDKIFKKTQREPEDVSDFEFTAEDPEPDRYLPEIDDGHDSVKGAVSAEEDDTDTETETEAKIPVSLYNAPPQILFDNEERINLWNDPNVPKKGWVCADVIDLGVPVGECGMCGKEDIRYVHIMRHDRHQSIGAGCVCAGNMEGDADASKERENALKNKISRYSTFVKLDLKISKKGNPYTKYKDTVITFIEKEKDNKDNRDNKDMETVWTFVENGEFSVRYKNLEEAKRAAFEKVDMRKNERKG